MKKKAFVIVWFILFPLMVSLACTCGFLPFGRDKGEDAKEPEAFIVEDEDAAEPPEEPQQDEESDTPEEVDEPETEDIDEPVDVVIQAVGDLATVKENFGVDGDEAYVGFVMKNLNTSLALTGVEYTINIMDGDGIIVGQENNIFPWLLPEQKSGFFFRVSLDEENPPPKSYNIVLEYENAEEPELSGDPFSSDKIKLYDSGYWPVVSGIIRNSSTNVYTDVRTSVLCYDADGKIIGGGYEYIDFIPGGGQNGFASYLDTYGPVELMEVFPIMSYLSEPYEDTAEFWGKISVVDQNFYLSSSDHLYGGVIVQSELDDEILEDAILNVTFYDAEGYVVGHASQKIDYLMPGERLGVTPYIDDFSDDISLSSFETRVFPGEYAEDFELTENVFPVNSTELVGDYQSDVKVNFSNAYTKEVNEVDVYVLLYDASGIIIGGGTGYTDEPTPAGGTGEAEVYVYYDDEVTIDSIEAWVVPSYWTDFE